MPCTKHLHRVFADFGKETVTKSSHLEKVCLIKDGVGDNISDFTTNLIKAYLCEYTQFESRISFSKDAADDYDKNIQIAQLNALNAALAVIKFKKLFGVYHDLAKEHQAVYEINVNNLVNDDPSS